MRNPSVLLKGALALITCVSIPFFCVPALAQESVRSELIRLQNVTGLTLVSVRDNKIYTISFAKGKLNETTPFPNKGTVIQADFSEDGIKVAITLCREPGLTHPTPYVTDCPGGMVLAMPPSSP